MLDHRLAQRNLAISCHDYVTVPADTKNCGGANQSLLVHLNNPSLYLARKVETGIKRGRFSRYVSFVESSSRLSSPPYRIKNSGFSSGSCRMISVQGRYREVSGWAASHIHAHPADLIKFNLAHCPQEMKYFGQEVFDLAEQTTGLGDPVYLDARALCLGKTRSPGTGKPLVRP